MTQIPWERDLQKKKKKNINIMQPMPNAEHTSVTKDGANCISNLPIHQSPLFQRLCDI